MVAALAVMDEDGDEGDDKWGLYVNECGKRDRMRVFGAIREYSIL